ncbi:restriction endonuclease subunit S [Bacterioplanoides pacificum]|uniref:Restriction endonuclease subunit S n=1 Tax=Bacterioplanoides pacificum TaxID=1171596 RepID=A0ABV7VNK1_9GAMM
MAANSHSGTPDRREGGNPLPEGWCFSQISDVSLKASQRKPDDEESFAYVDIGSINRDLKVIESPQKLLGKEAPSRARKVIKQGDVLVSLTRPNLNAVALVSGEFDEQIASTGFEVIHPLLVDSRYIFALTKSKEFVDSISGAVQGALYPAAKSSDVQAYCFPLPPLAEQKVIAEKLDTLLAQVDTTKARLERIPDIIKRFRQSVLAAAVSGKLTEEWRKNEGTVWQSLVIDDIGEVKGGKRLPKGDELVEENTGFPYIRAGQLKQGTVINTSDARSKQLFITAETQAKISRYTVNPGDLYITIVGASIGDAGVIPQHYSGANLTENAAKITEFKKPIKSQFLSYWLRSQELQDLIQLEIKSGAQGKLALKRIKELPVPYTDIDEQTEIVRRVEELFAFADRIEQKAAAALEQVNNLTQSILAKAFRGELTAGWRAANPELISGDNSAEALLAKIQAEREKLALEKKAAKKPRKKKTDAVTATKQTR